MLCQFCFTHDTLMKLTHITIDLNSCYSEMKYEADRNAVSYTITILQRSRMVWVYELE